MELTTYSQRKDEKRRRKQESTKGSRRRGPVIVEPEFIEDVVWPIVAETFPHVDDRSGCEVSVVRDRGQGYTTVEYKFDDQVSVFGKSYSDGRVPRSFELMQALWDNGFGNDQSFRISQPLAHFPGERLVLLAGATGLPLKTALRVAGPDLSAQLRQAARWLVHLHSSPVRVGDPVSLWDSAKLPDALDLLTRATANAPRERERLVGMVDALCRMGLQNAGKVPVVQTHGDFNARHVFIDGPTVTLIDFDLSVPADPATDLAEFLFRMRLKAFKWGTDNRTVDEATRVFLDEYLTYLPDNGANLALHWGGRLLKGMFRSGKSFKRSAHGSKDKRAKFETQVAYYRSELEAVLANRWMN